MANNYYQQQQPPSNATCKRPILARPLTFSSAINNYYLFNCSFFPREMSLSMAAPYKRTQFLPFDISNLDHPNKSNQWKHLNRMHWCNKYDFAHNVHSELAISHLPIGAMCIISLFVIQILHESWNFEKVYEWDFCKMVISVATPTGTQISSQLIHLEIYLLEQSQFYISQ